MTEPTPTVGPPPPGPDFIRERVAADLAAGVDGGRVQTRFPPEPNGYLHIGHAKAICLNFAIAGEFGGTCNLRFDDTNPETESDEFVRGIQEDLAWLGYEPGAVFYASDYFEQIYAWAELLVEAGLAYVDDQDAETISAQRGAFGTPGADSPYRDRAVAENLDLLRRMRAGEFPDGARVLRARIDMAHPNLQLRDPVLYRIRHATHHRSGDAWPIYPTYDWAHGQSDAIEGVTHSLCTLEFDVHRPLYDWFLDQLPLPHGRPRQLEFARLNLTHTVTSKRKLAQLVTDGLVEGWDDPRMPTLRGLRRRGYPASALRAFSAHIGVARVNGTHEIELLESFVRDELNRTALRRAAVLDPLRVVITNYPDGQVEYREAVNNPEDESAGTRQVPFSRVLYIEREDFMEDPAPKFYRLAPGREVRLRYAYFLRCDEVVKDDNGRVVELRCTYDPDTGGGKAPDGRKVKTTIHWVSAAHAVEGTAVLYERLFSDPYPDSHEGRDPLEFFDPASAQRRDGVKLEPALAEVGPGQHVQFERLGYFAADTVTPLLFHRTVGLRDEWARIQKRGG
ncbi:MAG: glutamine--tRNA ligase/YqeY domain fusion protein [Acidimicrobiia bacterium]|nr:glutamine--tRNA ligase/YqeY domain fusion protein [Acidimicrobiia bacterium]